MEEKTIFPREEHSDILFQKILNDPWACEKLQATFCDFLFCNDEFDHPLSPEEFSKALFESYKNRDLSAFLMGICQNTIFDLLRNSFLIPYRFNADGKQNPIIMTDENGKLYDYGTTNTALGLARPVLPNSSIQSSILNLSETNANTFNGNGFVDITFLKDFKFTFNAGTTVREQRYFTTSNPFYGFGAEQNGTISVYHYRTTTLTYSRS